ncbi:MAG TPA: hypothetical protein VE974_12750 [Thermoanaerobaculia bacterium]|nr:hypothetical protein [Thermoanaerobaculia bacterium]
MNKRIATLTLVVSLLVSLLAAVSAFAAGFEGAWTASASEKKAGYIQLNMTHRPNSMNGNTMAISKLAGLTAAQVASAATAPVRFSTQNEAGTIAFDGTFRNGNGAGQFVFTSNPTYLESMRALGVDVSPERERRGRKQDEQELLYQYVVHDVSTAYVKSMIAEGYRVPLHKYLELRIFDVTPEYIREMRDLGFRNITNEEVVASRIHRVTPDYVRRMRAAGWNLTLDELQSTSIHGATPEFAEEMKKAGYPDLDIDIDELVSFRIHRVTPEFIRDLRQLGYDRIDADDLVSMSIHRVTPEYIRELKDAGYSKVPVENLISMRIHNVDAELLRKMK